MNKKVSFCVFTYNHKDFIEECLRSVWAIEYSNLEIIISDDCSKDDTFYLIENFVQSNPSKHTIILNKNTENMGIGAHVDKIFKMASGEFIANLGGDDVIKDPLYIKNNLIRFHDNENLMMMDFNGIIINQKGESKGAVFSKSFEEKCFDFNDYIQHKKVLSFAPGRIFRRILIEQYPSFSSKCPTEDSILVLRALIAGQLLIKNVPVVFYRKHDHNVSNPISLRKLSIKEIINQYKRDAKQAYENNWLNKKQYHKLYKRILLEKWIRKSIIIRYPFVRKAVLKAAYFLYKT